MSSSNWVELSHFLASPPHAPPAYLGALPPAPPSINALSFDTSSDLLLTGNSNGGVTSWYGQGLARYTAWKADVRLTVPIPGSEAGADTDPLTAPRRLQTSWKKASQNQASTSGTKAGIRELYNDSGNVWSVSQHGVHCASRRGIARWGKDVAAMGHPSLTLSSISPSPSGSSSEIVVGGPEATLQDSHIISINRHVGSISRKVAVSGANVLQLRKSQRYILNSTSAGHIHLRDPRSLEMLHTLHAHPGGIIDMKSEGHLVWSIGWTIRLGHPVVESHVKVHDLRMMRTGVPLPFAAPGGPALIDIHPRLSSTILVAASQGSWQTIDMNSPGEGAFYHIPPVHSHSHLTSMSFSPSGEYIAFGESDGTVRLWSTAEAAASLNHPEGQLNAPKFNPFATSPPDLADPPEPLPRNIDWAADTGLSSIGLPYYDQPLLSVFPFEKYVAPSSPMFNPFPPKFDPAIIKSVRMSDGHHFGPLPRQLRGKRNLVKVTGRGYPPPPGKRAPAKQTGVGRQPMFRSERAKQRNQSSTDEDEPEEEADDEFDMEGGFPSYWRKKAIAYSKFGVEDFDFGFYNRTNHSGLENDIPNCYLNSLLQCLFQLPLLRSLAEVHAMAGGAGRCEEEGCLLCEVGFLFMMLRDAQGANCQATNVLRTFARSMKAISLGLVEDPASPSAPRNVGNANVIQTVNRFILDAVASSWTRQAAVSNPTCKTLLEDAFAPSCKLISTCLSCGHITGKPSKALVVDLEYPAKPLSNEPSRPSDFASVLKASLSKEFTTRSSCKACNASSAAIRSRRQVSETAQLPRHLSVNAHILTEEQMKLWIDGNTVSSGSRNKTQRYYLPTRISISSKEKDSEAPIVKGLASNETAPNGVAVYRLRSIVSQTQAADTDPSHLVSVVRVPDESDETKATWYLYNDFLIRAITEEEALSFPASTWRIPAIIYFERVDKGVVDVLEKVSSEPDLQVLTEDLNLSLNRDPDCIRHRVLEPGELPAPGTLISLDAEFVLMNPEMVEVTSGGSRVTLKPATRALGRVSVLHGQGEHEGEPFIDDHIMNHEYIHDYLTQFSGIVEGDLDESRSKHTVIQQKLAYKKLRLLVDLGCVFVGHGLKSDFRTINIHVPPHQIIDTVDLFTSSFTVRKMSLRFLSYSLLNHLIQSSNDNDEAVYHQEGHRREAAAAAVVLGGHDSIEDAQAALHLYRLYEVIKKEDRLEEVMEQVYEDGRRLGWKPPSSVVAAGMGSGPISRTGTPAVPASSLFGSSQ